MEKTNIIDDNLMNFVLSNIKLLLNLEEPPKEATEEVVKEYKNKIDIITLYVNTFCQEVIIKTNRSSFPEELKYLVIDCTIDMYNSFIINTDNDTVQQVQSMSETGRSVTFGTPENLKYKFQLLAANHISNNEKLINRYRLMYKVRCPHNAKS